MIERLFLNVVEITLATSWVILPLILFSSLLKKKYTAKWSYALWLIIAIRLILPINFELPQSAFSITVPNDFSPSITEAYTTAKDNLSKKPPINSTTSEEIDPDNPYNITSCFANGNGLDVFSKSPTDENSFKLKQIHCFFIRS